MLLAKSFINLDQAFIYRLQVGSDMTITGVPVDAMTNNLSGQIAPRLHSKRQPAQECFYDWLAAFSEVLPLMELIESDIAWIQIGGQAFYNDVNRNPAKLKLCDNEDWMFRYFYL